MKKQPTILQNLHNDLINVFEDVKNVVWSIEQISRAGLMLGLQEIGASLDGFVGAYYPISSNIIVMNKTPLRRILEKNPQLLKPYSFHVLLHEYLHALGYLDEELAKEKTYTISKQFFGEKNIITQMATNIKQFFPHLVYPIYGSIPMHEPQFIELVHGFDKSSTNYIT